MYCQHTILKKNVIKNCWLGLRSNYIIKRDIKGGIVVSVSKLRSIIKQICKVYVCLLIVFFIIQPDFKKVVGALMWGFDAVIKYYNIFTLFYILIIIMGIELYKKRGD